MRSRNNQNAAKASHDCTSSLAQLRHFQVRNRQVWHTDNKIRPYTSCLGWATLTTPMTPPSLTVGMTPMEIRHTNKMLGQDISPVIPTS